jgi:ESS family glutamate:Na+ symporter
MRLDLIQTVAFAGLILFVGYGLKRLVPALARYNIPAPVAGGLPVAALFAIGFAVEWRPLTFDTSLQTPLQNTFFASVGFGASVRLLKRGGPLVLIMMIVASLAAALQNVLGAAVAYLLGEHPLMGVLADQ